MMDEATWHRCVERWQWVCRCVEASGGDVDPPVIAPPLSAEADERASAAYRDAFGHDLPHSLRQIARTHSAGVEFHWDLPSDNEPPRDVGPPAGGTGAGNATFGTEEWVEICRIVHASMIETAEVSGIGAGPAEIRRWIPLMGTVDGDTIVLDAGASPERILHISHSGGSQTQIGVGLAEFFVRFSALGFPGPEDWEVKRFLGDDGQLVQPGHPKADTWIAWLEEPLRPKRPWWKIW